MIKPADSDPIGIEHEQWFGFYGNLGFEVGGNCGQTTNEMLNRFDRVVSFEPCAESLEVLRAKFQDADPSHLIISDLAVSDHDGTVALREVPWSLEKGMLVTYIGEDIGHFPVREVPCKTLDTLAAEYGNPDFVLIDVEGHEGEVLRGASDVLKKHVTKFLIEFHLESFYVACVEILEGHDYDVTPVRHPHYEPESKLWRGHGWIRALPA